MCRPSYHWQIPRLFSGPISFHFSPPQCLSLALLFPLCFLSSFSLSAGSFPSAFRYSSVFPVHVFCHFTVPTLCDPMDCSPPGSSVHRIHQVTIPAWVASVHGILQARISMGIAMPSSRGSSQSRD